MLNQFSRTELLLGKDGMERLKNARVAVFGIGGVGGDTCLLYTSPSPRDCTRSRMPSSA